MLDVFNIIIQVVNEVIPKQLLDENTIYHIQPSGRFVIGGPQSDAGLTGRKIIVDTYGGWGAHGGGAFSGKDYTKVDRSAAYAARWVAKSIVNAGLARRVLVQVSYAIGVAHPLSLHVETYGSGRIPGLSITWQNTVQLCAQTRENILPRKWGIFLGLYAGELSFKVILTIFGIFSEIFA